MPPSVSPGSYPVLAGRGKEGVGMAATSTRDGQKGVRRFSLGGNLKGGKAGVRKLKGWTSGGTRVLVRRSTDVA